MPDLRMDGAWWFTYGASLAEEKKRDCSQDVEYDSCTRAATAICLYMPSW